jgi:hypothetical protein
LGLHGPEPRRGSGTVEGSRGKAAGDLERGAP